MHFQEFKLEDKPLIDRYLTNFEKESSEFTFTNLIMWGQDGKFKWAIEDDVLFIMLRFGGSNSPFFFPPIPLDFTADYRKAILAGAKVLIDEGHDALYRSINGVFVPMFQKHAPEFVLTEDRNTFDYIYRTEDLIHLKGKKLHSKRNHLNKFNATYTYEYRRITADMVDACMDVYKKWLEGKDVYEPGILSEMKALKFILPNMDALGLVGGSIFIGGKLVAFTLGEQVTNDYAVIHIEKADHDFPGLYAVINQQFAMHEWSHLPYINREEDMGIEGMRKAKLSYHPVKLIEKFDAKLAGELPAV